MVAARDRPKWILLHFFIIHFLAVIFVFVFACLPKAIFLLVWWWFLLFLYTPVSAGLNQLDEKRLRCCCGSAAAFLIFCGFFFILEVHNPINGRPTLREVPKRPRSFSPRMCVCVSPLGPLGLLRALQETAKGWIIRETNAATAKTTSVLEIVVK